MKHQDPPRLTELRYAPAQLREALSAARADAPSKADLARVAARLPTGPSPVAPPPGASAAAAPSTLSGALIGAALGAVVSVGILWPARSEAPAPRPPVVDVAPSPRTGPATDSTAMPAPEKSPLPGSAATAIAAPTVSAVAPSASASAAPVASAADPAPAPVPGAGNAPVDAAVGP